LRRAITIAAVTLFAGTPAFAQEVRIKEDKPGLLRQAKVTVEAALATAVARVPGGKLRSGEIEKEGGKLIYSLILKVEGKKGVEEVNVDAMTGAIVDVEHESDPLEARARAAKPAPKKP